MEKRWRGLGVEGMSFVRVERGRERRGGILGIGWDGGCVVRVWDESMDVRRIVSDMCGGELDTSGLGGYFCAYTIVFRGTIPCRG